MMLFELKENMQVIRHNHEAVDLVALVIEMMQGVGDDLLWRSGLRRQQEP